MTFHWPQVAMLVLMGSTLLMAMGDHGELKTGKNNFFATLIVIGIHVVILYCGGFFS